MESLPEKNEEYGTKEYWDRRYTVESEDFSFDWFKSYRDVADIMRELIPDKSSKILMLGCGNSTLSQDMYDDGYKNIVNIDYSGILIEKMRHKHGQTAPEMEWHEMDIRDLKFETDSFDVAIDKGTMDAMMTAKADVWDPPEDVVRNCNREVDEVLRVLRPGGIFIYLTFGQPHFRRRYLDRPNTTLEIRKLGEAFHYYLYIVRT
ncbi:S-adenosyl-L-methionine-dependent methyltransferase [Lentinus tigrinus ALCF2SS1-7]|uniref:S-adenosyl-L-methionine-dependent methyltransferase n=1 Tax=Lentinus tigrinus ALCF2SS1-6 TaxID=1328759 RepID=A0A5C2S7N5_9APHY|nr:S-adenosyl-L-methionine-dependent methyltransferase [Lentinus tigrinus ALCF2SS1-6]RPD73221.1 S-adenosyl-L-methionine-dependent methyltransferase [Lentinus tigrinus ALCF2SS1-7]